MRRAVTLVVAVLALAACTEGLEEGAGALSSTPTTSASTSPSPSGPGRDGTIVVRSPRPGDEIVSPVEISGVADVFEGTVSIVILDASGTPLASTFTTATCGSGCRGRFVTAVAFFVEERQPGTISVFEESAEDGTAQHVVEVPVTLVPGL